MIRPRSYPLSFALLLGACAVYSCSVGTASVDSNCTGLNNCMLPQDSASSGADIQDWRLAGSDAGTVGTLPAKAACGVGSCVPDDLAACSDYEPPTVPDDGPATQESSEDDGALTGESTPDAGAPSGDAGFAAATDAGGPGDAGLDGGIEAPPIDGSFERPPQPDPTPVDYACRLMLGEDGHGVSRGCAHSGTRDLDESCTSSADCRPGLGCVGMMLSGRCLPFCCSLEGGDICGKDRYCVERPLRHESLGDSEGPMVPVCDRADDCSLGEPFPCEGQDCVCGPDTACTLVKPDGTTACLPPGEGEAGDACSLPGAEVADGDQPRPGRCSARHHCSQATDEGTCVRTCDLDATDDTTCAPGVCQATPALPTGWGTCVGATPEEMEMAGASAP